MKLLYFSQNEILTVITFCDIIFKNKNKGASKMKELAKKIAAFIVCTVVIVQVMSISSFASGEDREPNDKITQANSVSLNTTIYGTTSGGWDMDYYKFTLNSPGYISVLFYHDDGNNGHHIDLV